MNGSKKVWWVLWSLFCCLLLGALAPVSRAQAHESRPAYLEIKETAPGRFDVLWRTPRLAGMRLPVLLKFPDDVRNVTEPTLRELPDSLIERRLIQTDSGGLTGKRLEFVGLQATITDVLVRVQLADGRNLTMLVRPSQAWVEIAATQGPWAVAGVYLVHGIQHICFGMDHLLFVLGLLLIVRDRWMLVKTVTAFTLAHSLTLAIATLGYARAPLVPLNAAIALSILFLGPEIVRSWRGRDQFHYPPSVGRSLPFRAAPWLRLCGGADERRPAATGPAPGAFQLQCRGRDRPGRLCAAGRGPRALF